MTSQYPNAIDNQITLPPAPDGYISINAAISAIGNIENELGILPAGAYPNVRIRLDVLESRINNPNSSIGSGNSIIIGGTDVYVIAGSGDPSVTNPIANPGSLYLREDGYNIQGLYSMRPDGTWHQIDTDPWTAAGDLSGSIYSQEVIGIDGHPLPSLSIGNLNWTGSSWAFTPSPTTLPPDGYAGGDLTGSYPNPTLANVIGPTTTTGSSTTVPVITVNRKGQVIGLTSANIAFPTTLPPDGYAGGDLAGTYPNPTLISVGTAGTYGDATHYPVITTDSKGRVTSVTEQVVSGGSSNLVFNVVTYGADPTGVNDSSSAFIAAVAAKEAAKGGIVFIPAGYYKCLSTIDLGTCGVIQGVSHSTDLHNFGVPAGKTGSCIGSYVTSGSAVTLGAGQTIINNVVVKDFGIFNANITSPSGETPPPVSNLTGFYMAATEASGIQVSNLGCYGWGTGMNIGSGEECLYKQNMLFVNGIGMTWSNDPTNSRIEDVKISYAYDGILAVSCNQISITGGAIQGCQNNGIHIQPSAPGSGVSGRVENFSARNVWFENNNYNNSPICADILFDATGETPTNYEFMTTVAFENCHSGSGNSGINCAAVVFIRNPVVGQQNIIYPVELVSFYNCQFLSGANPITIPSWAYWTTFYSSKIVGIIDNGVQTVIINTENVLGDIPTFQIPTGSIFTAGGDLSGSSTSQKVIGIDGYVLPTLSTGNLNWTGSTWEFSAGELNLLDFGADPTGVADSSTALQAALTAMQSATTASLRIPHGTYLINTMCSLFNTTGIVIHGDGNGQTILKGGPGTAGQRGVIELKSCNGCSIRDLQIQTWATYGLLTANYASNSTTVTATAGLPAGSTWLRNWDHSSGDLVVVSGGNYTLSITSPNPYAVGDLLCCSSQSAVSMYVDIASSPTIASSKNQLVNVIVHADLSPYGVFISCAGGPGSSSDLDNELHVLDNCQLYAGIASLKTVGVNPLTIECNNTIFDAVIGIDGSQGGGCHMTDCSFYSRDYDIVAGGTQNHIWKSLGHFSESSGGLVRSDAGGTNLYITFDQLDITSDLSNHTVGTSTANSVTVTSLRGLRIGRQVSITSSDSSHGELATISSITPGTSSTNPVITFSANLSYSYSNNSLLQIPCIDVESSFFTVTIDNSKWNGYGANSGAWIRAIDTSVYANFSTIRISNSETAIMGWLLDGTQIHTTDSTLYMPTAFNYSGFQTSMQTYLHGAQWYSLNTTGMSEPLAILYGTVSEPVTSLIPGTGITVSNVGSAWTINSTGGASGAASGDLAGSYPSPTVAQISSATGNINWAQTTSNPHIGQTQRTTDALANNLTINAQNAYTSASTDVYGGQLLLQAGNASDGTPGASITLSGASPRSTGHSSDMGFLADQYTFSTVSTTGNTFILDPINAAFYPNGISPSPTLGKPGKYWSTVYTNSVFTDQITNPIAPTAGQFLLQNATANGIVWSTITGDVSASTSTVGNLTVNGIRGNSVPSPDGYTTSLVWNGSSFNWVSQGGPTLGIGIPSPSNPNWNQSWLVPQWYIDPVNGNDAYLGTSPTNALQTFQGLVAIWGTTSPVLTVPVVINYMGSSIPSDFIIFSPIFQQGASVIFDGYNTVGPAIDPSYPNFAGFIEPTVQSLVTVVSAVPKSRTVNGHQWEIVVDTDLTGLIGETSNGTAAFTTGSMIHDLTNDSWFWLDSTDVPGMGAASLLHISQPMRKTSAAAIIADTNGETAAYPNEVDTVNAGDKLVVYAWPVIGVTSFSDADDANYTPTIFFQNLTPSSNGYFSTVGGIFSFVECNTDYMYPVTQTTEMRLTNCRSSFGIEGSSVRVTGGILGGYVRIYKNGWEITGDTLITKYPFYYDNDGYTIAEYNEFAIIGYGMLITSICAEANIIIGDNLSYPNTPSGFIVTNVTYNNANYDGYGKIYGTGTLSVFNGGAIGLHVKGTVTAAETFLLPKIVVDDYGIAIDRSVTPIQEYPRIGLGNVPIPITTALIDAPISSGGFGGFVYGNYGSTIFMYEANDTTPIVTPTPYLGTAGLDGYILPAVSSSSPGYLNWTGSSWSLNTVSTQSSTLWFHQDPSSISSYETLQTIPSNGSQQDNPVIMPAGPSGPTLVDVPHATIPPIPGVTSIPTGNWVFDMWHYVSDVSVPVTFTYSVYSRTVGGVETLQFSTTTNPPVTATVPTLYTTVYPVSSSLPINQTDVIVIKVFASNSGGPVTAHWVYEGSNYQSFITTSFASAAGNPPSNNGLVYANNGIFGAISSTDGQTFVSNSSGLPVAVTISGDSTLNDAGVMRNTGAVGNFAVGGNLTVAGTIDRTSSGTLSIGSATATAITLGNASVPVTIPGHLTVSGTETIVGQSTFQTNAVVDGNLQVASMSTGVVRSDGYGNLTSSALVNADISPTAAIAVSKLSGGTAGQFLVENAGATSSVWTTISGDIIASTVNPGNLIATGLDGYTLPTLSAGYLQWNGSNWVFSTPGSGFAAGGDLTGTATSQTVSKLQGITLPTPSGTNTALVYNSGSLFWGVAQFGAQGTTTSIAVG